MTIKKGFQYSVLWYLTMSYFKQLEYSISSQR